MSSLPHKFDVITEAAVYKATRIISQEPLGNQQDRIVFETISGEEMTVVTKVVPSVIPLGKDTSKADSSSGCLTAALVFLGSFLLMILVMAIHDTGDRSGASKNREQAQQEKAERVVVEYLKNNLHNADSYEDVEWSPVLGIERLSPLQAAQFQGSTAQHFIRHKFRATNGFGGKVLENRLFAMDANWKVVEVVDLE